MINNINNNEYNDYDKNIYKFIIIGDSSVGKTSFIIKLCHNIYHNVAQSRLLSRKSVTLHVGWTVAP